MCGAAGEWEIAEEAFRRRSEAGVRAASRPLLAMLLTAYLNARQWDPALQFLRYMAQRGEPPSPHHYKTFLRWVRCNHPSPLARCRPEVSREANPPTSAVLGTTAARAPWVTAAPDVLRWTMHGRWRRLAAEAQQWDTVMHVYAETTRARAQLDEAGYRVLCQALHHSGRGHRVPEVLRDMSCAGFQYDAALALPPLERGAGS